MVLVAHPFASMLVTLEMTESRDGAAGVTRLRDAYLDAFGDLARALTLHRAIGAAGPDEVGERRIAAPVESMVSLLDDSHLGRT